MPVYNFNSLPQWNTQNKPPVPQVSNDLGYDIQATRLSAARRAVAYKRANGKIGDNQGWWPMFVTDITIDIALSGSTAQSRMTRDFYPRNFVQPNFIISGQALDQEDYGNMTDCIHHMQQRMLENPSRLLAQVTITGNNGLAGFRKTGLRVTVNAAKYLNVPSYSNPNQSIRGSHMPIIAQGYVGSIARKHNQGVYSPPYQFQFIVADMIQGPFSEQMAIANKQVNWTDILASTSNLTNNPTLVKQAQQIVKTAQQPSNITSVINSGSGG